MISYCRDFVAELKKSLACVLDDKTPSSLDLDRYEVSQNSVNCSTHPIHYFSRCIDLIGKDMIRRLDLTAEYIDLLNKIEVLNEKFNYVKK